MPVVTSPWVLLGFRRDLAVFRHGASVPVTIKLWLACAIVPSLGVWFVRKHSTSIEVERLVCKEQNETREKTKKMLRSIEG